MKLYIDAEFENITGELIDIVNRNDAGICYHTDDYNKVLRKFTNVAIRGDTEYLRRFPYSLLPPNVIYIINDVFDNVAEFINDTMVDYGAEVSSYLIRFAIGNPKKPLHNMTAIVEEILRRNKLAINTNSMLFIDLVHYKLFGELALEMAKKKSITDNIIIFVDLERLRNLKQILELKPEAIVVPYDYLISYNIEVVDNEIRLTVAEGNFIKILERNVSTLSSL